jgi:hypothetical protein
MGKATKSKLEVTCCDDCPDFKKGKCARMDKTLFMFPFTSANSVACLCPRTKEKRRAE